jgi:hypothetical protein
MRSRGCEQIKIFFRRRDNLCKTLPIATGSSVERKSAMKAVKLSLVVRSVSIVLALCLIGALASVVSAQTDPRVGTWKLNLAKSKFVPGPAPKSLTLTYEATATGLTGLTQGTDQEGKPINPDKNKVTIILDGKDHKTQTTNAAYNTTAWTRVDANTWNIVRKKDGKTTQTVKNVVSKDGKTLTITTTGVNAEGKTINNKAVYDKQ